MKSSALYLRTIVFGITDSLVSTVGVLAGIALAGVDRPIIILTGLIYVFVEAFSMAVGSFLSEESAEEYQKGNSARLSVVIVAASVMFLSYVLIALVPLAPYFFFEGQTAIAVSVAGSVVALFIAGMVSARFAKVPSISRGFRMAFLGGAAIVLGAIVGSLVPLP